MSKSVNKFASKDKKIKPVAKPLSRYQDGVAKSLTRDKKESDAQT